jgi:hypothetical protein
MALKKNGGTREPGEKKRRNPEKEEQRNLEPGEEQRRNQERMVRKVR